MYIALHAQITDSYFKCHPYERRLSREIAKKIKRLRKLQATYVLREAIVERGYGTVNLI